MEIEMESGVEGHEFTKTIQHLRASFWQDIEAICEKVNKFNSRRYHYIISRGQTLLRRALIIYLDKSSEYKDLATRDNDLRVCKLLLPPHPHSNLLVQFSLWQYHVLC